MNVIDIDPPEPAPAFRGCLLALLLTGLAIGAVQVALVAGCASAPELPEGAIEFVTNYVDRIISGAGGASSNASSGNTPDGDAGDAAGPVFYSVDIDWRFGGFDGSRAAEDPGTQIRDLRISGDGLSYKWARGDLGNWGLADTDAGAIAAAFYWDGERWVGGKFDWISTSRLTRSFTNIREGYRGWDWTAFSGASRHAFCIISKDGKCRTNLLEETR